MYFIVAILARFQLNCNVKRTEGDTERLWFKKHLVLDTATPPTSTKSPKYTQLDY